MSVEITLTLQGERRQTGVDRDHTDATEREREREREREETDSSREKKHWRYCRKRQDRHVLVETIL